jgi:hypothetical protein
MPYGQLQVDTVKDSLNNTFAPASGVMKNRIINGNMVLDQRNSGASVTPTDQAYTLDRWQCAASQSSKYTVQQNAGSVTPPVGFTNYLGVTSSSAYSITSTDYFNISQNIEGYNIADLGWGTANAKTVTLSAWVYSSLTGTFGGALRNSAANRSYPFTYTISSANTWTQINITIAGDTTGTWLTTNGKGVSVIWNLGTGSTYSGTAGSWSANNYISATGATSVVGTNGATFYITGVQLEVGLNATNFEYRQYGTEFALCQRYYEASEATTYLPSTSNYFSVTFAVSKRAAPSVTRTGTGSVTTLTAGSTIYNPTTSQFYFTNATSAVAGGSWTASVEL